MVRTDDAVAVRVMAGQGLVKGSVRITGGKWRRRVLHFASRAALRPTADMVRERLFNWLGQDLTGWHCLDLFAGSGALGFDAASRGADCVCMVERDAAACTALRQNGDLLGASGQVTVYCDDVFGWLQRSPQAVGCAPFDLVTLDPPFAQGGQERVLDVLSRGWLRPQARVYVEHDGSLIVPEGWDVLRAGRTGQAHYCVLSWGEA